MKKKAISVVGLLLLGLVALGLSAASVLRFRTAEGAEGTAVPATVSASASSSPVAVSSSPEPSTTSPRPSATSPSPSATETDDDQDEEPVAGGPSVVVIGDTFSMGEDSWVAAVSDELGWGEVTNLSSPGRGYITSPRSCDLEVCDDFGGTVELIASSAPDIVVTFGGTADGDYSITDAARTYFEDLRAALPDAELVAVTPVTGEDEAEYWLTLHRQAITAAVEAVDGTVVNVGQPGLGDGSELSAETQAVIAETIVDQLSAT